MLFCWEIMWFEKIILKLNKLLCWVVVSLVGWCGFYWLIKIIKCYLNFVKLFLFFKEM